MTPSTSLDAVRIDTSDLTPERSPLPGLRRWTTPERDAVSLALVHGPPALPTTERLLWSHLEGELAARDATLVERYFAWIPAGNAVIEVDKSPQEPAGFTFRGRVTLPFRDLSVIAEVVCAETEDFGTREATLRARLGPQMGDRWLDQDPHDHRFPQHPVSRLRRHLVKIMETLTLDPDLARLPRHPVPVEEEERGAGLPEGQAAAPRRPRVFRDQVLRALVPALVVAFVGGLLKLLLALF